MSAVDERDRFDARLARGASGLLLEFNDAGVLAAADVHVAHRLAGLIDEADVEALVEAGHVRSPWSRTSLSASTSAADGCQVNTPHGTPSTRGVSGPVIPRMKR